MCDIMATVMASTYDFQTCISSLKHRNQNLLPVNHKTEGCVREEYIITYTY
jgi:hypothetical protein